MEVARAATTAISNHLSTEYGPRFQRGCTVGGAKYARRKTCQREGFLASIRKRGEDKSAEAHRNIESALP